MRKLESREQHEVLWPGLLLAGLKLNSAFPLQLRRKSQKDIYNLELLEKQL